jgi:glycosyltransferase involved in cell wall biosynthesis
MRTLLLVRNGVDHDARVLRAARVAEQTIGGGALVVGVATASAPTGAAMVEGVRVLRLSARRQPKPVPGPSGATPDIPSASCPPDHSGPPAQTSAPAQNGPSAQNGRPMQNVLRGQNGPSRPSDPLGKSVHPGRLTRRARTKRVLSGVWFAWQALAVARRERPALVHANDWNTMWCAVAIKLVCRARLVYDSHELWPDRNGRWEWRPWLLASEALFVRVADAVITASPGYADALSARHRMARPTVVRNIPDGPPSAGRSEPQAPPLVVYVGGLMPGRGLEQTIDALALAPAIRLRAVGPGSPEYRAGLIERATAVGVADRLELCPPVPPGSVGTTLREATAGLCLIQPVCRSYELTLPNKLFEYAAAGVPVLVSDLPVIAAVVRRDGLGEVAPSDDPRGIAAGLERLVEPGRWCEAARCSRAFALANDWKGESRVLAQVYSHALARLTDTSILVPPPRAECRPVGGSR